MLNATMIGTNDETLLLEPNGNNMSTRHERAQTYPTCNDQYTGVIYQHGDIRKTQIVTFLSFLGKICRLTAYLRNDDWAAHRMFHKLPHTPQATTTEQHETGGSLKNTSGDWAAHRIFHKLPHIPQATTPKSSHFFPFLPFRRYAGSCAGDIRKTQIVTFLSFLGIPEICREICSLTAYLRNGQKGKKCYDLEMLGNKSKKFKKLKKSKGAWIY